MPLLLQYIVIANRAVATRACSIRIDGLDMGSEIDGLDMGSEIDGVGYGK